MLGRTKGVNAPHVRELRGDWLGESGERRRKDEAKSPKIQTEDAPLVVVGAEGGSDRLYGSYEAADDRRR